MRACGIVLAAGAGTRFGFPKGLALSADGTPWVSRAVRMLQSGGCDDVVVVVGARGGEVSGLVPDDARVVTASDWATGMSASLRAGLEAARQSDVAVVTTVDTPDAAAGAVTRVLAAIAQEPRDGLVQAVYGGRPGHPVAIGSSRIPALLAGLSGDRGARPYLVRNAAIEVECSDLWTGADIDTG